MLTGKEKKKIKKTIALQNQIDTLHSLFGQSQTDLAELLEGLSLIMETKQ